MHCYRERLSKSAWVLDLGFMVLNGYGILSQSDLLGLFRTKYGRLIICSEGEPIR